jgi:hypothetical protein
MWNNIYFILFNFGQNILDKHYHVGPTIKVLSITGRTLVDDGRWMMCHMDPWVRQSDVSDQFHNKSTKHTLELLEGN